MLEFAPFSAAHTAGVSRHASEPYVSMLHTLDMYILIRLFCVSPCYPICLIFPKRCFDRDILVLTSDIWCPPALNIELRYFEQH